MLSSPFPQGEQRSCPQTKVNLKPCWKKGSEQPSASSFCPYRVISWLFQGRGPLQEASVSWESGTTASPSACIHSPSPSTPHNTPNLLGVDNAVYSPGLGSGPDLTGRVSISLPHSVAAAAAAAARQPNLGYSVAFRGQKWLADDGQSSGGHDPHSLTKASCAACVWRQGTGAGTGWILSSEAIPDECISVSLNIP